MMRVLFFILFLISQNATAQEAYSYYESTADLGRGGVRFLDENDAGSMLLNPAFLGFNKGMRWTVTQVQLGANNNSQLLQSSPLSVITLPQYYGKNVWSGASAYTALMVGNWGFAAYYSTMLNFYTTSVPQMEVESYTDYGFILGYGYELSKSWSLGFNFKRISRRGGATVLNAATLTDPSFGAGTIQNAISNAGTGYGIDVGLVWKGTGAVNPTVSLNWQDAGYVYFYPYPNTQGPPSMLDNLNLSMTMHQEAAGFGWAAGMEYRHIRNVEYELSKKFHFGTELNLSLVDLRAGFNQGWVSYGLAFDLWFLNFDCALYSIERGVYSGQNPDQRAQIGISFDASFDADFNLTDIHGKRRRLKQRR